MNKYSAEDRHKLFVASEALKLLALGKAVDKVDAEVGYSTAGKGHHSYRIAEMVLAKK